MIASLDDGFVVGCLKDLDGADHGVADAFGWRCTMVDPGQETVKWSTWDDGLFSRRLAWELMESSRMPSTALQEIEMNMRRPLSSPDVMDTMT